MADKQVPRVVVGVLISNKNGDILLARAKKWKDAWVVPGGHLEYGERLEDAVKREVKEETNLDVSEILLVDIQESIFSEGFHEKRHFIFLDYSCKADSEEVILNDELQEFKWLKPESALGLELNNSTRRFIEKYIGKRAQ